MTRGRLGVVLACMAGVASILVGCGGGGGNAEAPAPVAHARDFPQPNGMTLAQLARRVGQTGRTLSASVSELETGTNRFGFAVFDRSRSQIANAATVVYVAPIYPTAKKGVYTGGKASGPFPARYESLAVEKKFQSRTVALDPDAAKSVYVADVRFPKAGIYQVLGVTRLDNRLVAAPADIPFKVNRQSSVPSVGERAPLIHTPTAAEVHGDLSKIDTRDPHDSMHDVDFANVVGKKPVVLVFATPQLCQSRVCGPVVDLAVQAKSKHPDVTFIHMEIYPDNEIKKGCSQPLKRPISQCFRPQVVAWHLPTEPWLFTIDRRGRIAARIEGAFSAAELDRATAAATRR